jgi:hypothetical protein
MEKKILKFYETPAVEIIETELEGFLCASNPDDPFDGSTAGGEEGE